jgi:imidazolonepropionase
MNTRDQLFVDFRIATMQGLEGNPLGLVENGALAIRGDSIAWVGKMVELPESFQSIANRVEGVGKLITPGLIDCHTHLVFGGNRIDDWRKRLEGVSYQEIARQGGGILSTVRSTRETSSDNLFFAAKKRLVKMISGGVTTIEIKSGYGLDVANELKMLRAIEQLAREMPVDIFATLLAAHAVPEEFRGEPDRYIDLVCNEILPACEAHCTAVDVFCESIAFDLKQTERVLRAARDHGKAIKLHAEQLSLMGAARLAAEFDAISADHLEYLDEPGVAAMANHGTVATLLPGAFYFLRERQRPPVELLRSYGVPMAVATDFNPGSSPLESLRLAANMSAMLFGLTPTEALLGITLQAARALKCDDRVGSLHNGRQADFVCWDCESPFELIYEIGGSLDCQVYKAGIKIAGL